MLCLPCYWCYWIAEATGRCLLGRAFPLCFLCVPEEGFTHKLPALVLWVQPGEHPLCCISFPCPWTGCCCQGSAGG